MVVPLGRRLVGLEGCPQESSGEVRLPFQALTPLVDSQPEVPAPRPGCSDWSDLQVCGSRSQARPAPAVLPRSQPCTSSAPSCSSDSAPQQTHRQCRALCCRPTSPGKGPLALVSLPVSRGFLLMVTRGAPSVPHCLSPTSGQFRSCSFLGSLLSLLPARCPPG